mmetsp:Transcript_4703/g.9000  ORF Transcript_4703/g.9000 Transcript_4703/m.9000 type:complete len:795 (+) Transcript_4703:135-2519(+)
MSNPRLVAEDIARHFEERRNKHVPHAKNVRKYLRKPVLAVTRRILLPRFNYDDDIMGHALGSEQFGTNASVDPTISKAKEGLDWRDYLTVDLTSSRSMDIETDLSFSETETEIEEERKKKAKGCMQTTKVPVKYEKLSRRSLARMEAFLASCAYALPNDAVSSVIRKKDPIQNVVPSIKSLTSKLPLKLSSISLSKQDSVDSSSKADHKKNKDNFVAEGLEGFKVQDGENNSKKGKQPKAKPGSNKNRTYPQMHINDLTQRLELYIRTLRRVYASLHPKQEQGEEQVCTKSEKKRTMDECVIHLEPARAMKSRIKFIVNSLISTVGSVGSMQSILTNLLVHFTKEQLAVEMLSDGLYSYIRKICLEYEHLTSFASLAFLSTPEDSADTQLVPLLTNYVEHLQKERERIIWECRLESTLARVLDPDMRKFFKTIEFISIGHLLQVCHEHRHSLENIVITERDSLLSGTSATAPNAERRDSEMNVLSSASFDNNTMDLCNNTKAIKQALRDLRRETIIVNGQILPPVQSLRELIALLKERLNSRPMKLKEKKIGKARKPRTKSSGNASDLTNDEVSSDASITKNDTDLISSGNEGDEEDIPVLKRKKNADSESVESGNSSGEGGKATKRRQFNIDAIDILIRRLLVAASRTRGSGDAYFVVQDLFGGEDVQVVPSRVQMLGPYDSGNIFATIEITVRLASITIKCHSKFDVYPNNIDKCEPYIQLDTTTTETIELQEVRVDDCGLELEISVDNNSEHTTQPTKVMLKEKVGEGTGRRILSIKPAKYERFKNLHTPS